MKSKTLIFFSFVLMFASALVYLSYAQRKVAEQNVAGVFTKSEETKPVKGIILPHHGVASDLISQSLSRVAETNQYSTIVIFSPNHYYPEEVAAATTDSLESADIATETVNQLTQEFSYIANNPKILNNEHGVTTFLPFLNEYFPQAKTIPVIFSPHITSKELNNLSFFFKQNLPDDTLYLLSLDFSHNSNLQQGLGKNGETIKTLAGFDYDTLYSYKDDHLDSPKAAGAFLLSMQRNRALHFEVLQNTHSAVLLNDPRLLGTSYVIGVFHE